MLWYIYLFISVVVASAVSIDCFTHMGLFTLIVFGIAFALAVLLGLAVLHFALLIILSLFASKHHENPFYRKLCKGFVDLTLETNFEHAALNLVKTGFDKLPEDDFLLICNHISNYDPLLLMVLFKHRKMGYVSKIENFSIPFAGALAGALDIFGLDRGDLRSSIKVINDVSDFIKDGKGSIVIYPEGTRNKTDELLLPFHAGSFKIAKKAKAPIVVSCIAGTNRLNAVAPFMKKTVYYDIIDVIPVETVKKCTTAELSEMAREMIEKKLLEHKQ